MAAEDFCEKNQVGLSLGDTACFLHHFPDSNPCRRQLQFYRIAGDDPDDAACSILQSGVHRHTGKISAAMEEKHISYANAIVRNSYDSERGR
jgi:hypothetical protein